MEFSQEEQEEAAYVLTKFAKAINPNIDEDKSFELMMEMLDRVLTVERVKLYGAFIRESASVNAGAVQ